EGAAQAASQNFEAMEAQREAARAEIKSEALNPDEVFMDQNGKLIHPKEGDPPMIGKRSDGRWVRIDPAWGGITYIPGNDPANAARLDVKGDLGEGAPAGKVADADAPPSFTGVSSGQLILFFLLFMLPFFYIPMALAVASSSDSIAKMFNPA